MAKAGADQYTFHLEATDNPHDCIRIIKESGMKVRIVDCGNSDEIAEISRNKSI